MPWGSVIIKGKVKSIGEKYRKGEDIVLSGIDNGVVIRFSNLGGGHVWDFVVPTKSKIRIKR